MITEILFEKIDHYLQHPTSSCQNFDDVAFEAVAHTLADILLISHVPFRFLDTTEEFLLEEAWDFIQKKTYGYRNLRDYQRHSGKKTRNSKK